MASHADDDPQIKATDLPPATIEMTVRGVRVKNLEILREEVNEFLRPIPDEDRPRALVRAVEVGVFCLERASSAQNIDFVRREMERLLAEVDRTIRGIPPILEERLVARIGTDNGQVLAPLKSHVDTVTTSLARRLDDVRALVEEHVDPTRESSTMGEAMATVRRLLDPKRTDSVQGSLEAALDRVTGQDGVLASCVKQVVREAVTPLANEVDRLAKEIRGHEAATEALRQTTAKGFSYEEEVCSALQLWAAAVGAEIEYVGKDNLPGDFLVAVSNSSIGGPELSIVVEARDRERKSALGRRAITRKAEEAMAERQADGAVYVNRGREGLALEIGDWAEGHCDRGPFVATTHDHLITAIRFLVAQLRLAAARELLPDIDRSVVEAQLGRIATALRRVGTINRKVTQVRGTAGTIQEEAEALREDIRSALFEIEEALRPLAPPGTESAA